MLGNKITSEMYERERFVKVAHDMGIDFNVVFSDEIVTTGDPYDTEVRQ